VIDAIDAANEEFQSLAASNESSTVRQYGESLDTTYPELLIKMAAMMALDDTVFGKVVEEPRATFPEEPEPDPTISCDLEIPVTLTHIQAVNMHLRLFMHSAFNLVESFVEPSRFSPPPPDRELELLMILYKWNCINENVTAKTIENYVLAIAQQLGRKESAAWNAYAALKKVGLVDSKQVGSHDSRVWLTEEGLRRIKKLDAGTTFAEA